MGYLYACHFSNGFTKIGASSINPMKRISSHSALMTRHYNANITEYFVSDDHGNYKENEKELISVLLSKHNLAIDYAKEWFLCDIESAVSVIGGLSKMTWLEYREIIKKRMPWAY